MSMGRASINSPSHGNQRDASQGALRRKTASELAVEDRARLHLALETAQLFTWELNPATLTFTFSDTTEAVLGFTLPADVAHVTQFVHPEDRDDIVARFEHALQGEEQIELEHRLIHPSTGESVWISAQTVVIGDEHSGDTRLVGVSQNVTERKQREVNAAFLIRLGDSIRLLDAPQAIQREATRLLGQHLGANRVIYGEILADGTATLGPHYTDGVPELPGDLQTAEIDPAILSFLDTRQTVVCDDVHDESETTDERRAGYDAVSLRAHVNVPIVKNGRLVAALSVHQSHPRTWNAQEVAIIEETAERICSSMERARAEEQLRESEVRYRTLFETIDEGFCVVKVLFDDDGTAVDYRFLEVNPAFERHSGLHDAAGKRMRELAPDVEDYWIEYFGNVATTGEPVRLVERSAALNDRWFDTHAFRIGDPEACNVAVLFTDVSEAKHAEEALFNFEERLRRAIEIETIGVIFFKPDGAVTFANEAFLRMSGYSREDVENGVVRWDRLTPPEWINLTRRAIGEALNQGRSTPYEKEYFRKNGSRWWALSAASRIGDNEGVKFIIDTSGAKRAESERERLAAIVENSRDAVIGIDLDGDVTDWNPAAKSLFGYSASEIVGHSIETLIPADRQNERANILERLSRQENIEPFETVWLRRNGTPVEIEIRPSPVLDPMRRVVGAAVIARDATERRRLERAQEDFLAMASHDLRSPVTVLSGRAQLMKRRQKYDDAGVDTILEQARRIERLVADLQELVKLEAGGFELDRGSVELGELVHQAVERARVQAAGCAIHILVPETPVTGQWDRDRLGQVLDNLIGNAIKYSPEGGDVTVGIEHHDGEVHLRISDQGPGISPESLPQLFERFYRADKGSSSGLGLGLYIARMLVEAHGGRVWADSEPGHGSTFTVALPFEE